MIEHGELDNFFASSLKYFQENTMISCESDFNFLVNKLNIKLKDIDIDSLVMNLYARPLLESLEKFIIHA